MPSSRPCPSEPPGVPSVGSQPPFPLSCLCERLCVSTLQSPTRILAPPGHAQPFQEECVGKVGVVGRGRLVHARAWGIPWGSWQLGRRRKVTGSYHSQCLLLLEFPGPHLSPFGMLLTCLCGQNRVEGLPHPAPPAFQALAPAALSCLPDPHSGPHPSGPFPQSSSPQSPALLPHATQLSPSGAEHF